MKLPRKLIIASAVLAVTACGGGNDDNNASTEATTSVSGKLADGYLVGAKVCLDLNTNGACDANEPFATTTAGGAYTISGVTASQLASHPLVSEVPATATDEDTGTAVGSVYVLMAPAGKSVITPLTTLVQQALLKDATKTVDTATTEVKAAVASLGSTDLFADYIAGSDTNAHTAAKVLANSLMANYGSLGLPSAGKAKDTAITLAEVAKQALASQGSTPDASKPVGVDDANSLRAAVAARGTSTASATQDVTLTLDLVNNGRSVKCGDAITLDNTALWDHSTDTRLGTPGATGAQSTPGHLQDTRFFVSNVMLIDASGNAVPLVMGDVALKQSSKGLALMDFGNSSSGSCSAPSNTTITGKVVPGTYTGIALTIGVPVRSADFSTRLNHANTASTDTTVPDVLTTGVSWTWQSGRKFMKIEFKPDTPMDKVGAATAAVWNVHVGSTGCSGDPLTGKETACTNPNRLNLQFDSFNASTQKIVLDIAQLFREADLSFEGGGAAGCMSGPTDPECAPIFKALGLSLSTGRVQSGASAQTVFSVASQAGLN